MNLRLLVFAACCLGLIGCPDHGKAMLRIEHDFTDRQVAGRTYFLYDSSEKTRAVELMSEIANRDAELKRTMLSSSFKRLPIEEQMRHFNHSRQENWQLIKELRVLLAGKESL
jgi:hypothetical protein